MTDAEKELRRLAQEATPGPWKTRDEGETNGQTFLSVLDSSGDSWSPVLRDPFVMDEEDKAFIAAANPAAVLALLERIEALEGFDESGQRTLALVMKSRDEAEAELEEQRKRIEALEKFAEGFATTAEAALAAHEAPKGGMQVPYTDDFAHLTPSIARNLRGWVRRAREALAKP